MSPNRVKIWFKETVNVIQFNIDNIRMMNGYKMIDHFTPTSYILRYVLGNHRQNTNTITVVSLFQGSQSWTLAQSVAMTPLLYPI